MDATQTLVTWFVEFTTPEGRTEQEPRDSEIEAQRFAQEIRAEYLHGFGHDAKVLVVMQMVRA